MTYGVYSIDAWIETEGERVEAGITHAQVPGMSVDVVFRQHLAVITRGGIDDQRSQPSIDHAPINNTFWTGREFTF